MSAPHEHRWDKPWRGKRRCVYKLCRQVQYQVAPGEWRNSMSLRAFAEKWLPTVSGVNPVDMMTVRVAFPFEWNCYESWQVVYRVRFDFTAIMGQRRQEMATRVDIMNGWMSNYHEDFCRIDHEAEQYYLQRTQRTYDIGDNTTEPMRAVIQSPVGMASPPPPPLRPVS